MRSMRWRSESADRKVNWVLDADIRGFFDTIDHGWLIKFIEHRIADRRVLRLIQKWLRAGVMEQGKRMSTEVGSPQGATVSPLLANICLHYALDLWVQQWRRRRALGDIIIVRYADDFVLGFQHAYDAKRFLGRPSRKTREVPTGAASGQNPASSRSGGLPPLSGRERANPVHRRPSTSSG